MTFGKLLGMIALGGVIAVSISSAKAEEACSAEEQIALDSCVDSAVASCVAGVPGCTARDARLEELEESIEKRCIKKLDGSYRPERSCEVCIRAIRIDMVRGPLKRVFPIFSVDVLRTLDALVDDCGGPVTDEPDNQTFCERFPNHPKCNR